LEKNSELSKMNFKKYIRFFIIIILLVLFYLMGLSLELIIFLGIFMLLLLIFRTKLYNKVGEIIKTNFKFVSKLPKWAVRILIVIIFILIYILIKQIIFEVLKIFGLDIQKILVDNLNQSLGMA